MQYYVLQLMAKHAMIQIWMTVLSGWLGLLGWLCRLARTSWLEDGCQPATYLEPSLWRSCNLSRGRLRKKTSSGEGVRRHWGACNLAGLSATADTNKYLAFGHQQVFLALSHPVVSGSKHVPNSIPITFWRLSARHQGHTSLSKLKAASAH